MVRKDTNRHYSLRKLKTGTTSVAVALTVLGAGFANQTEVKAADHPSYTAAKDEVLSKFSVPGHVWAHEREKNDKLSSENEGLKAGLQEKEQELKNLKADVEKLKDAAELERLKNERHDHDKREAERKALEDKLADKQEHLDGALRYINEKEAERKEKEAEQKK
ncbi:YSIRK-type signal peptide-containing protein, partial [Streptococcus pyogenes]|nr:YSIRK-type signal peptide-containing protein [Streptococcus pyogenes]HEQ9211312.1 YSIRK-type signal peptide-containing protein [Streptococcus pyogenes]HER1844798.1 YSIRK-type signal peptide-containing protein [Streptococcus pyogenes]HER1852106.1 YSIRK-type signal peptide-containing protein [Streptococcus pyogenes]HER1867317.1 YSIRK-type signal peptide-containing protein [Streptococcus pyogenes]